MSMNGWQLVCTDILTASINTKHSCFCLKVFWVTLCTQCYCLCKNYAQLHVSESDLVYSVHIILLPVKTYGQLHLSENVLGYSMHTILLLV